MKYILLSILLVACAKEHSHEPSPADKATALELQAWITGKSIRLISYTAEQPVIYPPGTTPETDLGKYVPWSIWSDSTVVSASQATIYTSGQVLTRPFGITADDKGVHVAFVDYQYRPLAYDYEGRTDSTLVISVPYKGTRGVSVFEIISE